MLCILSSLARALFYSPYGEYFIKEGKKFSSMHNSIVKPRIFILRNSKQINWLKFRAIITPCKYNILAQEQINKLVGYNLSLFKHHHKNSLRIGWRIALDGEAIEILSYSYINGIRHTSHIKYIHISQNDIAYCDIEMCTNKTQHIIIVDGIWTEIPIPTGTAGRFGWVLQPYFGGHNVAPHDIEITLVEK
jgi:hypothetical protein